MVIFHFFVSVILVGLGLNRSIQLSHTIGLGWFGWVGSKSSHGFAEIPSTHNSGSAAPSIDQSLWSHQMFIIFCWWKDWKRSQQFSFTFFVMWWECHLKIHQHHCNDENDWYLQVYTGGVFSPMSEDGSDYQQMDSFQVVMTLQWWYCWSTSGFEMFRICDL